MPLRISTQFNSAKTEQVLLAGIGHLQGNPYREMKDAVGFHWQVTSGISGPYVVFSLFLNSRMPWLSTVSPVATRKPCASILNSTSALAIPLSVWYVQRAVTNPFSNVPVKLPMAAFCPAPSCTVPFASSLSRLMRMYSGMPLEAHAPNAVALSGLANKKHRVRGGCIGSQAVGASRCPSCAHDANANATKSQWIGCHWTVIRI